MKRIFLVAMMASLTLGVITSCKKGDTGPAGTANVTYSPWFTATPWTKDTIFGIWGFNFNQAAPDITQHDLDSSAILVFGKLLGYNPTVWGSGQVGQLPINLTYVQGSTMTDTWSARASVGNVRIRFVNDKNYYTSISTSHQFRYIIIPGGKLTGRFASGSSPENMTYSQLCQAYHIPE